MNARWLVGLCAVVVLGCASASDKGNTSGDAGELVDDAGEGGVATLPTDKLTWSYVYRAYFATGTPGHCGQGGCHGASRAGFACTSQSGCYDSITASNAKVGGKMVDPSAPAQSVLLDAKSSPVYWFNQTDGNMPNGALVPNATAVADITAWIEAGAPNN